MRRRIEAGLMARVQRVLDARHELPRAKVEGRPKLDVITDLQARDEDGGGTYAELMIYDEISWFGITAADIAAAMKGMSGALNVRINSPGGDVFDGVAIYNLLAEHDGQVTVTVDGLAASAASFIAMAGDEIIMNRAAQMMIHDASGLCIGDAADMTNMAELLDRASDTIAGIYAERTGVDAADWRTAMRAETWYNADEAVTAGLATKMAPARRRAADDDATAVASFDLTVFQYAGRAAAPAPVIAKALPVHHTATEDSAWDGPAAVAAMPNDDTVLRYCHAWQSAEAAAEKHEENDDDADDQKGNYKFPHHRKDGGPANIAACRNGLSRLSGADIPDSDRAGVEAHLRAHLKDGGDDGSEDHAQSHVHDGGPGAALAAADPVEPPAPDDWAATTAHLITSPDDEWARLTEGLL